MKQAIRFDSMVPRCAMALWLSFGTGLLAQTRPPQSVIDGTIPASLEAGTPAGSYALSGIESINLYNGQLGASVPLLKIGGRGDVSTSLVAGISRPPWIVNVTPIAQTCTGTAGPPGCWQFPTSITSEWWNPYGGRYGPGVLLYKYGGYGATSCVVPAGDPDRYQVTFGHLVFVRPDGTESALYDTVKGGGGIGGCFSVSDPNAYFRGGILGTPQSPQNVAMPFTSRDGSGMTFLPDPAAAEFSALKDDFMLTESGADTNFLVTGKLMMPDGSEYTIVRGLVYFIRDRNGNRISFEYDVSG